MQSIRRTMNMDMEKQIAGVDVGGRMIGRGSDVYIIAEAGVSHDGDVSRAREMVHAAKECGADAVKFQIFSADRLAPDDAPAWDYQNHTEAPAKTQRELLRAPELESAELADLRTLAASLEIDFLATPFGLSELETLMRLSPPAIKIASPDLVNAPLLSAAAKTGLPLLLSTGAATVDEIDEAVSTISVDGASMRLILLHCVSAYPTEPVHARLGCIHALEQRFSVPVGFSDHTLDHSFGILAVSAGAVLLEKHLTLDAAGDGPDHYFSLEPASFKRYVDGARQAANIYGDGALGLHPCEEQIRLRSRGGIVAARDIAKGCTLTPDDLLVQRPGVGIPPNRWNDVIGCAAR